MEQCIKEMVCMLITVQDFFVLTKIISHNTAMQAVYMYAQEP